MIEEHERIQRIDDFIQAKMRQLNTRDVGPVEATKWLVEEGLRNKIESRPGAYLRRLCRAGKIMGAEKINKTWRIKRR